MFTPEGCLVDCFSNTRRYSQRRRLLNSYRQASAKLAFKRLVLSAVFLHGDRTLGYFGCKPFEQRPSPTGGIGNKMSASAEINEKRTHTM